MDMGAFERELMRSSPLAGCVPEVGDYVIDEALPGSIWRATGAAATRTC